ncbi:lysozyme inhibitor LprI family protein [Kingella negevensis]|uniref:lysozyme inhibitor LprI family protein n=1 Tax=Kingella negevensis TaxID=1522312 RepID=UPI00254D5B55|nr:lysozyme inhibitor LprI family protein [Kingella negevensis]MDK4684978.1 lysozyme inhibitor LprI family protein [Kingella negevensis]
MKKHILSTAIFAALALSACSDKKEAQPAASAAAASTPAATIMSCDNSTFTNKIRDTIQQSITSEAQRYASQDTNQFIDSDKLIAAAAQLDISVNNAQAGSMPSTCQAQVAINIPQNVLAQARTNAPLLQLPNPAEIISKQLIGSNATFNGETLTFPLNLSIQGNTFAPTDNNLSGITNLLAQSLLAYGVKDTLNINGQPVARETLLRSLQAASRPEPKETQPETASTPRAKAAPTIADSIPNPPADLKKVEVAPISASAAPKPVPTEPQITEEVKPEVLTPPTPAKPNKISDSELESAQSANRKADQSIKSAWRKIDPEIQRDLVNDQRAWERKKQQACRSAAATGSDESDSRYKQLQCDTRLVNERIQYLNGYSID